jgi:hypothetical protein
MKTQFLTLNRIKESQLKGFTWSFAAIGAALLLSSPDAFAVQAGEMKTSVDYLKGLLDNNIVPAVIGTGIVAGMGLAFMKSTFSPLLIALSTAVAYGFANKWITTVYALCV